MNVIKQFDKQLSPTLAQGSISTSLETRLEPPSIQSEAGKKSTNQAVDIDLSACLTQLRFLIQDLQLPGDSSVTRLKRLASALNAEMSPVTAWGWRYIHQVSFKHMAPSKKLKGAIYRLYIKRALKRAIPLEQITVLAPVGYVQENSILGIRSKECARGACLTSFIPTNSRHIYCCLQCGKQSRRERKRNNILLFRKELGI